MVANISYSFPARGRCKKCGGSNFHLAIIQPRIADAEPNKNSPALVAGWAGNNPWPTNSGQGTSPKLKDTILKHRTFGYSARHHHTLRGNEKYQNWESTDYYRCDDCDTIVWAVRSDSFMVVLTEGPYYY